MVGGDCCKNGGQRPQQAIALSFTSSPTGKPQRSSSFFSHCVTLGMNRAATAGTPAARDQGRVNVNSKSAVIERSRVVVLPVLSNAVMTC